MKWAGFLLMLLGSGGAGFCMAAEYMERIRRLSQIRELLQYMQELIVAECIPLPETFLRCADRVEEPFCAFLRTVSGQMDEFCGEDVALLWKNNAPLVKNVLHKKDYEGFRRCMEQTGFMDAKAQGQALRTYEQSIELQLAQLIQQKDEKCRLYQTLGIMAGIFVCILLI
jgi:stage III sporulation protein AB